MKKLLINIIYLILSLCLISCNKTDENIETTVNEEKPTKIDEETSADVPKTILWDTIDAAGFDDSLLYFSIEKELLDELKSSDDEIYSIRLMFRKNPDAELTSVDIFKICKYLLQDLKYSTNFEGMSDAELNEEIEISGTKNLLFFLSKEDIYKLLEIEWSDNFQLCIMGQETEFDFFDDDFVHYAIEPDLCHKLHILQSTTNKLFPIDLMIYKETPGEMNTNMEMEEKVSLLRYMSDELKVHTNYEDMSNDELIASIRSSSDICFYLSKDQIYEFIEIDWPKDFMIHILWEDTDILR